jgi:hypothetical protein
MYQKGVKYIKYASVLAGNFVPKSKPGRYRNSGPVEGWDWAGIGTGSSGREGNLVPKNTLVHMV